MFDQLSLGDLVAMASEQPRFADEPQADLLARVRVGDTDAVEELVRRNLRIAIDEAIRVRGLGTSQRELIRIGVRALVEAVTSYEPTEHGSFPLHARAEVRAAVVRGLSIC